MAFIPWTEIESFHNIRKFTKAYPENLNGSPVVKYQGKVKLHGTNAAVQCRLDGSIVAQSRTTELTVSNDNAGFARWVKENEAVWQNAVEDNQRAQVIIYGEWIGPGVQKGVAVSEIPKKCFVVFAARPLDTDDLPLDDVLWVDPDLLTDLVAGIPDTYVLPWHTEIEVDWSASAETLTGTVDQINQWVLSVEQNDPWVEDVFGVKGTGEGIVYYPVSESHAGSNNFNNLVFKAKGEKHKNIKTAAPAQVDASAASNVNQFVDMVLTDARLEQGATAVAGTLSFDMKLIPQFLIWIATDVQKETQDELEASNLEWKQVSKSVNDKARGWYIKKFKEI